MADSFNRLIEILMVEDDPGDVDLTRETLDESKIRVSLNVVEDGVKALEYLHQKGQYANAARPDMILLDLNLPKKDGREVLAEIKSDPNLRTIPVVVLTTSDADEDIFKTYDLGANCYITKPVGLDQFSKVVKSIENFWFTIVKMPKKR
jgi:two-component system response regulator